MEIRLKGYISPEDTEKMKEIQELHNSVLQRIENIQNHTSKQFFDQEKQIIKFFDSKIKEIKNEYETERVKHREKYIFVSIPSKLNLEMKTLIRERRALSQKLNGLRILLRKLTMKIKF